MFLSLSLIVHTQVSNSQMRHNQNTVRSAIQVWLLFADGTLLALFAKFIILSSKKGKLSERYNIENGIAQS